MRWTKGQSGNPAGKPPGAGKVQKLRDAIQQDVPEILSNLATQAKAGDVQAAKLLLERTIPALRPETRPHAIPSPDQPGLVPQGLTLLEAVGRGEVPADVASQLVQALGTLARVTEMEELKARLEAIESQLNEVTAK
jgi:hypothetical protein